MTGTIRWNFIVGAAAFVLTFCLSFSGNIWLTTLLRSLYSGIILFLFMFPVRWILSHFAGTVPAPDGGAADGESVKGQVLDLVTPEDGGPLPVFAKEREAAGDRDATASVSFEPLDPPKLSTKVNADLPLDDMVQAVRRMSQD